MFQRLTLLVALLLCADARANKGVPGVGCEDVLLSELGGDRFPTQESYEETFMKAYPRIQRIARHYAYRYRGKFDPESVVDDLMGKVHLAFSEGKFDFNFGVNEDSIIRFFSRVLKNGRINEFTSKHSRTASLDAAPTGVDFFKFVDDVPTDSAAKRKDLATLKAAISKVPEDQRIALELQMAGKTHAEI